MSQTKPEHPSRRELLANGVRYTALGALACVGGAAMLKRRRLVKEGKCIGGQICRGCEIIKQCSLPQALSAKKVLGKGSHG